MATVSLRVTVPARANDVWQAVRSPRGFEFVSRGLIYWPVASSHSSLWVEGETVRGWMFFFGFLPVARHSLTFTTLNDSTREFRTAEHGGIIRSWQHSITVTPLDAVSCAVDDTVTFDGGIATPLLDLTVRVFYWIRRPRWIALGRAITDGSFTA